MSILRQISTYRCISGGAGNWRVGLLNGLDTSLRRSDVVVQIRKGLEGGNQWKLGGSKITRRLTRAPENVMTAEEEKERCGCVLFFLSCFI
jgi:hypothetical protein